MISIFFMCLIFCYCLRKAISKAVFDDMAETTILPVDCDIGPFYIYNMKHLSILALEDATMNCIDSCYQVLTRVNDFRRYKGQPPFYNVEIVGAKKKTAISKGLYNINVTRTIDEVRKTDVIFVP